MCLIGIAKNVHPVYPFMLWANRDEFYERPAKELHKQPLNNSFMLAGKDLTAGGTWLGLRPDGKLAAVTNVRKMAPIPNARSRGEIIPSLLKEEKTLADINAEKTQFNGFNLIYGSIDGTLQFATNQNTYQKELTAGVFALSNGGLSESWPKVAFLENQLQRSCSLEGTELIDFAFKTLGDSQPAADELLPDTGVGYSLEKMLSPAYIESERYGTRCSSVILLDQFKRLTFIERTYHPAVKNIAYDFPLIKKALT